MSAKFVQLVVVDHFTARSNVRPMHLYWENYKKVNFAKCI